jgi:putative ABC transport system ATP-binding protein
MARQVMELLHNLNQEGTTIIMVTHDPDQAREVSRNIQIIDGQISDFKIYEPLQSSGNSSTETIKSKDANDA